MKLVFESKEEMLYVMEPFISNNIFPEDITQAINGKLPDECYKNGEKTCTECWNNFFALQKKLGNIVIEEE